MCNFEQGVCGDCISPLREHKFLGIRDIMKKNKKSYKSIDLDGSFYLDPVVLNNIIKT